MEVGVDRNTGGARGRVMGIVRTSGNGFDKGDDPVLEGTKDSKYEG